MKKRPASVQICASPTHPKAPSDMAVSLLIVVDDSLARIGLRTLLGEQPGWKVSEARNAEEAMARARELHPDIILIDTGMRQKNGIEVVHSIVRSFPGVKVLVLDDQVENTMVWRALRVRAFGYLRKSDAETDLVPAVTALTLGRVFFPATVVEHLSLVHTAGSKTTCDPTLSQAETKILQLITLGTKNKDVAQKLDISVRTLEEHRKKIRQKLGLATFADLVRYAIRNGIIEP